MLLCSVSMAFIVFFFLLYFHLFSTPTDQLFPSYSGEIATNYGPSCSSETPDGRVCMGEKRGIYDGTPTGSEMSNLDNSFASPNNSPPSQSSPFRSLKKFILHLVSDHESASVGGVAAMITLAYIMVYKMNKQRASTERLDHFSLEGLRCFSLNEILSATKNFNPASFIRHVRFGDVYGGLIDNGKQTVAIKRLSLYSHQRAPEFWNEVKALSKLRHANLVSLIGYCNETRERILVYEFMPLGTLADNLYINNSLSWEQRLRICIGAARGLDHLHTGTDRGVIHGDLKSSNILLDEKFKAKISDFGLTEIVETMQLHSHVNIMVKGTPREMDPADRASQLVQKSDVYSFGVVLFEVLCGRTAVNSRDQEDQPDLISWARGLIHSGRIDQIVDSRLNRQISPKCLKAFVEISEKCLCDDPKGRPTMVQLVAELELLLDNHVVGESNAKLVQDLDRETTHLEAPAVVAQPSNLEAPAGKSSSDDTSSSFGLWAREPSRRSEELTFPDGPCHCFSISDIVSATGNFSSHNIIIHDGLYTIYQGRLTKHNSIAIVKNAPIARVNCAKKGMPDISTELKKLSYLDHSNLASIVGYCSSDNEMIIVYEYSGRGTLLQHLNRFDLPWKNRLNICISAAKALRHLHVGTGVKIIHGDISPTTIFLDDDWGAKVVHFGSIISHLNARNAGELELMPPEFADSTKLTEKSDVYLFGLLLLVLLCGKEAYYDYRVGRYPLRLPGKVREAIKKKTLHQITDMKMWALEKECVSEFLKVAFSCLSPEQVNRPSMDAVVEGLKKALSLQR